MAGKIKFDAQKFRELLLYVADKSADDPFFGATKLNKILFFSDFIAYGKLGRPITGATYRRLDRGPAPRELLPVQEQLEDQKEAIVVERRYFGHPQKRLLPLREPTLSGFSAEEVALVDGVIEALRYHNAAGVSVLSHLDLGWRIAGDRQMIPYESVFLSDEAPTPTDIKRGQDLADEHGWRGGI